MEIKAGIRVKVLASLLPSKVYCSLGRTFFLLLPYLPSIFLTNRLTSPLPREELRDNPVGDHLVNHPHHPPLLRPFLILVIDIIF